MVGFVDPDDPALIERAESQTSTPARHHLVLSAFVYATSAPTLLLPYTGDIFRPNELPLAGSNRFIRERHVTPPCIPIFSETPRRGIRYRFISFTEGGQMRMAEFLIRSLDVARVVHSDNLHIAPARLAQIRCNDA